MGRVRIAGVSASVALVLVAVTLALLGAGDDSTKPGADREPRLVSAEELEASAVETGHAVYWAGSRPSRLELTVEPDGAVYLRYLPAGTEAGERPADLLTVGSFPLAGAFEATREAAAEEGASLRRLPGGVISFQDSNAPGSAYLAFPGSGVQVEVYDPLPGKAMALIRAGAIRPVGE